MQSKKEYYEKLLFMTSVNEYIIKTKYQLSVLAGLNSAVRITAIHVISQVIQLCSHAIFLPSYPRLTLMKW